jgi:DNA-binding NarL/FixJ family response regulator
VILLVALDTRRAALHAILERIEPRCRVESASSPLDASHRLMRDRTHLLVLDLAFGQAPSLALIHHVARSAPSTLVVAFDEVATRLPIQPYDVWSWHGAETVMRRTLGALS